MAESRGFGRLCFTVFAIAAQKIYKTLQIFFNNTSGLLHCATALSILHIMIGRHDVVQVF
jgi:hypothetical protein